VLRGQAPANFHTGRERRFKGWNCQADIADERMALEKFRSVQAEAMATKVMVNLSTT